MSILKGSPALTLRICFFPYYSQLISSLTNLYFNKPHWLIWVLNAEITFCPEKNIKRHGQQTFQDSNIQFLVPCMMIIIIIIIILFKSTFHDTPGHRTDIYICHMIHIKINNKNDKSETIKKWRILLGGRHHGRLRTICIYPVPPCTVFLYTLPSNISLRHTSSLSLPDICRYWLQPCCGLKENWQSGCLSLRVPDGSSCQLKNSIRLQPAFVSPPTAACACPSCLG